MAPSLRDRSIAGAGALLKFGSRLKVACQCDPAWAAELVLGLDQLADLGAQAQALITLADQFRYQEAIGTLSAIEDFIRLGYRYDHSEGLKVICDLKFRNETGPIRVSLYST